MKERMIVVQLRGTIFLQQKIGYTAENASKFQSLLLPESKIYGIPQPGVPMLGVNPVVPQYGLPWRLFKKCSDGGEYNIAFQPGKIDIVLAKEMAYGTNIEEQFCQQCIEWFSKILDTQNGIPVIRIAYAPLYAIKKEANSESDTIWANLLKKTVYGGKQAQDINLQFVLKQLFKFGENDIQMNLLHSIFDGKHTKLVNGNPIVSDVLLMQLDLNSIPEYVLNLDKDGVADFFNKILEIKGKLVENVG